MMNLNKTRMSFANNNLEQKNAFKLVYDVEEHNLKTF